MNEPFSAKLRSVADRIEAYAEDKLRVKQAVIDSCMIGGTGIAVVLNSDQSQSEEVRRVAGRVASTLGALYCGRISASTAVARLRLEVKEVARTEKSIAGTKPIEAYKQPLLLPRDRFIWENILTMSMKQLIQSLENKKNFGLPDTVTTPKGFKDAAFRYSQYHKLPTRNFRSETPYMPSDTD